MRKIFIFVIFIIVNVYSLISQEVYYSSYKEHINMIENKEPLDFKRAVFITENAFYDNEYIYESFCEVIKEYALVCEVIKSSFDLTYQNKDKEKTMIYASVFKFMTDTVFFYINDSTNILFLPFLYNFDDFSGEKDWSNMFVIKLLETNKGNCHSLPILYKLIVEEMGERAWLSFAPNHLYIKLRNEQSGWYNTELTTGFFPTDAWLISSGFIHLDAVRSGIYMDTLSQVQSVAMCLIDLAEGFQRKFGDLDTDFVLTCCETALKYYPNYINAMLLQAETLMKIYRNQPDKNSQENKELFEKLNSMYAQIHKLGYRKMPDKMYLEWLMSIGGQVEFQNQNIDIFKQN